MSRKNSLLKSIAFLFILILPALIANELILVSKIQNDNLNDGLKIAEVDGSSALD